MTPFDVFPTGRSSTTVDAIRRFLLGLLLLGLVGTAAELVLLRHYDGACQLIPLTLIALALLVIGWHLRRPGAASVHALQVTMTAFIVAGVIGVFLHYQGNLEFQMETDRTQHGSALFWKVMRAEAPPALAPGVMTQLGLLGLIYAFRHPAAARTDPFTTMGE